MDIHIAVEGHHDLSGQIYRQLRAGILEGRLAGGTRLPSTRDLADATGRVAQDDARRLRAAALRRLSERARRLGHVRRRRARAPAGGALRACAGGRRRANGPRPKRPPRARSRCGSRCPRACRCRGLRCASPYDFMGGATDKTLFPFDVWRRCVNHALRAQARGPRHRIATRPASRSCASASRAIWRSTARWSSNWEDVIVTQGAQQALDLLARVMLQPGEVVALEEPGYPPAHACFAAHRRERRACAGGSRGADRRASCRTMRGSST